MDGRMHLNPIIFNPLQQCAVQPVLLNRGGEVDGEDRALRYGMAMALHGE